MATYGDRFLFSFDSVGGSQNVIAIMQANYTGAAVSRRLGRAPIIRKDKSGVICGTSLELYAECEIDEEYAILYTSDPRRFKVEVRRDSRIIWTGFVTTELYSDPDVAPPYDVQITATDGLGLLKDTDFPAMGEVSLNTMLTRILSNTGLSQSIYMVSTLNAMGHPEDLLTDVSVDLDYLTEGSCYDALVAIMQTLHATITSYDGVWLIVRETDVENMRNGSTVEMITGSGSQYIDIIDFGSAASFDVWPVGHLTRRVEPARKSVKITSKNHYRKSLLPDPDFLSNGWGTSGNVTWLYTGVYELGQNGQIYSVVNLAQQENPLELKIKAICDAQVTSPSIGRYYPPVQLSVRLWATVSGTTYYLSKDENDNYRWGTTSATISLAGGAGTEEEFTIPVPLPATSSASSAVAVSVEITNTFTSVAKLTGCTLSQKERLDGYTDLLSLSNNARLAAEDVEISFCPAELAREEYAALYGVPSELSYETDSIGEMGFMSLISRDYALSVALPRLRKEGKLYYDGGAIPLFIRDSLIYIAETFSWDILNDEVEVSALSLPATAIQVEDETITAEGGDTKRPVADMVFTPSSLTFGTSGGSLTARVRMTRASFSIDTSTLPSWLTVSPTTLYDNTVVTFTAAANTGAARSFVLIGGRNGGSITINQLAESVVTPARFSNNADRSITNAAQTVQLQVVDSGNAGWYIQATSGYSFSPTGPQTGSGTVTVTIPANTGNLRHIVVRLFSGGAQTDGVDIIQAAGSSAADPTISPTTASAAGAAGTTVQLTITDADNVGWRLTCSNSEVTFSQSSGTGSATVTATLPENTTGAPRHLVVYLRPSSGSTSYGYCDITQAAAVVSEWSVRLEYPTVDEAAGTFAIYVKAPANEQWELSDSLGILTFRPASGTGTGEEVEYEFDIPAYPASSYKSRATTIYLGDGQVLRDQVTLTQAHSWWIDFAGPLPAPAGSGTIEITAPEGEPWSIVVDDSSWLHVSAMSGTGPATIPFTVDANTTGNERETEVYLYDGNGQLAGNQNITVIQLEGMVNPSMTASKTTGISAAGETITLQISNPSSVAWTLRALYADGDVTFSQSSGSSDATVTAAIPANTTGNQLSIEIRLRVNGSSVQTITLTQNAS